MNISKQALDPQPSFEQKREYLHLQILSSVSHDLKTPLTSIIGSLEIYERMKSRLSQEKQDLLIVTALQEAYRLDSFITNILDMAKLDNGMVEPRFQLYELGALLDDCTIKMQHRLKDVNFAIVPPPEPLSLQTDPALLVRALICLLDNAIKYSTVNPSIRMEYEQTGNQVQIRVIDNGPGIPEGKTEEIFDKYTRLVKQDHQNAGTGLGLPICRGLVSKLGGTVSASNRPEGGACFVVSLPVAA